VPVCTDCHQSHNIEDPRTVSFHLRSPALCASCHADPKRMKKVGLSVSDHRTYVGDFHGRAVPFAGANRSDPMIIAPVCTDCHGVHRIVSVDDPQRAAIRDNMMKTCRACHEGDVRTAPAAWFSHYEPTPARAPLVYGVLLFYKFFIPVMVAGFVVQILLHVWRVVVNR
jgi:predicted CXXCH cytochrome family protein